MRTCVVCAAMLLGSCETHEVRLAFNTKDSTAQKYLLDSQLKVIVGGDSNAGPMEAMNSRVQARILPRMLYIHRHIVLETIDNLMFRAMVAEQAFDILHI